MGEGWSVCPKEGGSECVGCGEGGREQASVWLWGDEECAWGGGEGGSEM